MNRKTGFTLIELLVVVLILGILASIGTPQYLKTVETSKATDSIGIAQMVAGGYRMCMLDNPSNSGKCDSTAKLVAAKYISDHDWTGSAYTFTAGTGGGCKAQRKSGTYSAWGYIISGTGACTATGGAPSCPKM